MYPLFYTKNDTKKSAILYITHNSICQISIDFQKSYYNTKKRWLNKATECDRIRPYATVCGGMRTHFFYANEMKPNQTKPNQTK